jgi:hypothetical protein
MLLFFSIAFLLSFHCSKTSSKPLLPLNRHEENPTYDLIHKIFAAGNKVLSSKPDSFDFESARTFARNVRELLKVESSPTKEVLIAVELATELFMNLLKRADNDSIPMKRSKKNLRTNIGELISLLNTKIRLVPNSDNKFLVTLSSIACEDLKTYKSSKDPNSLEKLRVSLKQLENALICLYSSSIPGKTSQILESIYIMGYETISKMEINFLDKYLELVNDHFFKAANKNPLSKDDATAMKLQAELLLKKLGSSRPSEFRGRKYELANITKILQTLIDANTFADSEKDQITISRIVVNDLLNLRSFDRYEETLRFIEGPLYADDDAKGLKRYLSKSLENRHFIIPDFDEKDDISAALDSAKGYFGDSNDAAAIQQKIFSFYMLVKYWMSKNPIELNRAVEAYKKLASSSNLSQIEASALWMIGDYLKIGNKTDLFSNKVIEKFKASFPKSGEEFTKAVTEANKPLGMLEIIAVNMVTNFTDPLIHKLIIEIDRSEYGNFCPGSDKFRLFIKQKAIKIK